MSEVITVQDLETLKKHEIFEAEVLTGKVGGLAAGANIDYATNAATGQVQKTLPAILRDIGFRPAAFTFTTGGTLAVGDSDVGVLWPIPSGGDGQYYIWKGAYPKTVPPASTPAGTGGVSDAAWLPVGDITLREELSAPNGINLIGGAGEYVYIANGVDDSAGLLAADTAATAAGKQLRISGAARVVAPVQLTAQLFDTFSQIFTMDSAVTVADGQVVRPEWFGDVIGAVDKATKVLPANGGTVYLEADRYKSNGYLYNTSAYMSKANVHLLGKKMPWFNGDCTALVDGSIIEGSFLAWAPNLELSNVGFDSGKAFCDANFSGVAQEGLVITYPTDAIKNSGAQQNGLKTHNVVGLCKDPTAGVHAVILGEGYRTVRSTGAVVGMYGTHGVVFKNTDVIVESAEVYCNGGEGVILKSDAQATAVAHDIKIGVIKDRGEGPVGHTPHAVATTGMGLMLNPALNPLDVINIGDVFTSGHPVGVGTSIPSTFGIREVRINSVSSANCANPVQIIAPSGVQINQLSIGVINGRACTDVFTSNCATEQVSPIVIGEINGEIASSSCVVSANKSNVIVNTVSAESVAVSVAAVDTAKLKIGGVSKSSALPLLNAASNVVFQNGWTQKAGGPTFSLELSGYRVRLVGLVAPGTTNTVGNVPVWARPSLTQRYVCQGATASAQSAVPVAISTTGDIVVNEIGGGTANCTQWLSLDVSWEI